MHGSEEFLSKTLTKSVLFSKRLAILRSFLTFGKDSKRDGRFARLDYISPLDARPTAQTEKNEHLPAPCKVSGEREKMIPNMDPVVNFTDYLYSY